MNISENYLQHPSSPFSAQVSSHHRAIYDNWLKQKSQSNATDADADCKEPVARRIRCRLEMQILTAC